MEKVLGYKVGDKVMRIHDSWGKVAMGDVHVVEHISEGDYYIRAVRLKDTPGTFYAYKFKKVISKIKLYKRVLT